MGCRTCVVLVGFLAAEIQFAVEKVLFPCIRDDPSKEPTRPSPATSGGDLSRVHVVYGSDAANFGGLLVSMLSLNAHLREPGNCSVHVIVPAADMERGERLLECFRHEVRMRPPAPERRQGTPEVVLHSMRPLGFNITGFSTSTGTTHHLVYTKFVLQDYLPSTPRALWLDTDTIVQADIAPLYRMPMAHPLAATMDYAFHSFEQHRPEMHASTHDLVKNWKAPTFTTGVLLYNLERWRAGGFLGSLSTVAQQLSGYDGEQMPMNIVFQDDFDYLEGRWNVIQPIAYLECSGWLTSRDCIQKAWILHATGKRVKYWHAESNRLYDDLLEPYLPNATCEAWLQSWRNPVA